MKPDLIENSTGHLVRFIPHRSMAAIALAAIRGVRAPLLFALTLAFAFQLHAGPRTSADYSITADSADAGGTRTSSFSYTNDGSAGSVTGISTVASPSEFTKAGYIGQLYEVTALVLNSSTMNLNETTGTAQLGAGQLLDDSSILALPANSIAWSVQSGPITSISNNGLATAGTVYQDMGATVQGSFGGNSGTLNVTVLNVNKDDFGTYAGDGIDDAWQVQYFGVNNPHAAPNFASDGSGLTNIFKYSAGLIPNNAASTFTVNTTSVTGQPTQRNINFSPTFADRNYTILSSTDLTHWDILSGPFAGNGGTGTVTDTDAGGSRKFYRVQIDKP